MMAGVRDKVTDLIFRVHVSAGGAVATGGAPVAAGASAPATARSAYTETATSHETDADYGAHADAEVTTSGGGDSGDEGGGTAVAAKPIVRDEVKVGRNDPCPCGSGKKYKKCCGESVT